MSQGFEIPCKAWHKSRLFSLFFFNAKLFAFGWQTFEITLHSTAVFQCRLRSRLYISREFLWVLLTNWRNCCLRRINPMMEANLTGNGLISQTRLTFTPFIYWIIAATLSRSSGNDSKWQKSRQKLSRPCDHSHIRPKYHFICVLRVWNWYDDHATANLNLVIEE